MQVLVDSSVWIDYFRGGKQADYLDVLIEEDILVINDLILAELVPFLKVRYQHRLIELLNAVERLELKIDWQQIVQFQYRCMQDGINGIGIPDLIIGQNALQNHCAIYSFDQHFQLIKKTLQITMY